jgi:hypothetical protein
MKRIPEVKAAVAQADMPGEWTEQGTAQVIDQYTEQSPRWTKGLQEEYVLAAILVNLTTPQEQPLLICFSLYFARMTSLLPLPDQDSRWMPTTQQLLNGAGSMNVFHASSSDGKRQPSITTVRSWT